MISVEFSSDEERQQTCPVQDVFVSIIDDDINEADVQYFIARLLPLSVESAVNISAIRTDQPVVLCRIMDDDGMLACTYNLYTALFWLVNWTCLKFILFSVFL